MMLIDEKLEKISALVNVNRFNSALKQLKQTKKIIKELRRKK